MSNEICSISCVVKGLSAAFLAQIILPWFYPSSADPRLSFYDCVVIGDEPGLSPLFLLWQCSWGPAAHPALQRWCQCIWESTCCLSFPSLSRALPGFCTLRGPERVEYSPVLLTMGWTATEKQRTKQIATGYCKGCCLALNGKAEGIWDWKACGNVLVMGFWYCAFLYEGKKVCRKTNSYEGISW